MKKMVKKILIIIGIIIITLIGLLIWAVARDFKQEEILKQEIINYSNKDFIKDDFPIDIKSKGDYAYIEKAIKKYYKELADNIKIINYYINSDELTNILSIQNLEQDRPNFIKSHAAINKIRDKTTKAIENISKLCEKNTIDNLINKDKIDEYNYELYLNIMYTNQDIKQLEQTNKEMEEISSNLTALLDKLDEILNFFEANNYSWISQNDQLYFETDNLVTAYNSLYKELFDILNKFDYNEISNNSKNEQL